ncbi:MAG: cell division protein FtsQ/DivIB [Myxococcota bacterium]
MNPFKTDAASARAKANANASASSSRGSAAREKRARDHLARKRRQERMRLERERGRQEAAERSARMRGVLGPILFFGAIVLGMAAAEPLSQHWLMRDMPLETIAVQGAAALSPEQIAHETGLTPGASLHEVDPERIREVVAARPWIESARTLRLPNRTLVVSVVEREAIARWQAADDAAQELIEPDGSRFPGSLEEGGALPLVSGAASAEPLLPSDALEILDEIKRHDRLAADPSALTLHLPGVRAGLEGALVGSQTGYVLQIGESGPRALLGRRLLSQRVARLAALLESEEATVQSARLIDLRYADRAVLRSEEPPTSG